MIKTGSEWLTLTHKVIPLVLSFMLRPANSQHTVLSSNIGKMMTLENQPVSKDIPILSFVYVYIYNYIYISIHLPAAPSKTLKQILVRTTNKTLKT